MPHEAIGSPTVPSGVGSTSQDRTIQSTPAPWNGGTLQQIGGATPSVGSESSSCGTNVEEGSSQIALLGFTHRKATPEHAHANLAPEPGGSPAPFGTTSATLAVPITVPSVPNDVARTLSDNATTRLTSQGAQGQVERAYAVREGPSKNEVEREHLTGARWKTYIKKSTKEEHAQPSAALLREARTQMAIPPHPGVAKAYGITNDGALLMEDLKGGSLGNLKQHLRSPLLLANAELDEAQRNGSKDALETANRMRDACAKQYVDAHRVIAAEMLAALGHLHRNDFVHSDIKPDNVAFDENMQLKLIDFGAATKVGSRVTTATPGFRPQPGHDRYSESALPGQDIYAVGVTIERAFQEISGIPEAMLGEVSDFVALLKTGKTGPSAEEALRHPFVADSANGGGDFGNAAIDLLTKARAEWYQKKWEGAVQESTFTKIERAEMLLREEQQRLENGADDTPLDVGETNKALETLKNQPEHFRIP